MPAHGPSAHLSQSKPGAEHAGNSGSAPGEFCSGNGAQLSLVLAIMSR